MLAANPADHVQLATVLDANHDGTITDDEIANSFLVRGLLAPDLTLYDGDGKFHPVDHSINGAGALSFGFAVHLTPVTAP